MLDLNFPRSAKANLQGFSDQTRNALAQGVVKPLDVISQTCFLGV
jgi:hypothetical protein